MVSYVLALGEHRGPEHAEELDTEPVDEPGEAEHQRVAQRLTREDRGQRSGGPLVHAVGTRQLGGFGTPALLA